MAHTGCWRRAGNRDNLGKDNGENGKRRMTGKGEKKGRKWEALGATNGGGPRRWPGEAPREPVLWSSDQGIKGTGGTSGTWSRSVGYIACYSCQSEPAVPLLPAPETLSRFSQEVKIFI